MAKEEHQRRGLRQQLTKGLDLPLEAISTLPRLELVGNRELLVEGHRGILEYRQEQIRLSGGSIVIVVTGQELSLSAISTSGVRVTGRIDRLLFEY